MKTLFGGYFLGVLVTLVYVELGWSVISLLVISMVAFGLLAIGMGWHETP